MKNSKETPSTEVASDIKTSGTVRHARVCVGSRDAFAARWPDIQSELDSVLVSMCITKPAA